MKYSIVQLSTIKWVQYSVFYCSKINSSTFNILKLITVQYSAVQYSKVKTQNSRPCIVQFHVVRYILDSSVRYESIYLHKI